MKDRQNEQNEEKKSNVGLLAAVILILVLAAVFAVVGGFIKLPISQPAPEITQTVPDSTEDVTEAPTEMSVTDLMKSVMTLKDDLETAADDIVQGNTDLAGVKFINAAEKANNIRVSVDATLDTMGDSLPSLQEQLANVRDIMSLVQNASGKLLQPLLRQLDENPIASLQSEEGLNIKSLLSYLDFAETVMPELQEILAQLNTVDLSIVDSDGDIEKAIDAINGLMELYQTDSGIFSRLKTILGVEGDRLYVIAAQNSAEVRASGGFPGAVGTLQIKDGSIIISDFKKVYDVFSSYTPVEANVTQTESRLFHSGLTAPRDADYCPDFERVAYIWSLGYETGMGEPVDGVISMTPALVQQLLAAMGEEITLFDGMVLNGENAAKGLQHDLYFNYFGKEYVNNAMIITDQLFADAAKKVLQKLTENLTPENLLACVSIAGDAFKDRTLMLWSKDEAEQTLIRKMGWNAGLNTDPQNPWAGIYYNCTIASKMGWFLAVDTQMGDGVRNEDGSYTYPITVTFTNTITQDEANGAQSYITGGHGGAYAGSAYFFAPAGGRVDDFVTTNNMYIQRDNYHDLDLGFISSINIQPGSSVSVSYNLTTAPGVDTIPVISRTPTMQAYH